MPLAFPLSELGRPSGDVATCRVTQKRSKSITMITVSHGFQVEHGIMLRNPVCRGWWVSKKKVIAEAVPREHHNPTDGYLYYDDEFIRIQSLRNDKVKHCVKLTKSKSYRDETGTVMLCGNRVLMEMTPYLDDSVVSLFIYNPDDGQNSDDNSTAQDEMYQECISVLREHARTVYSVTHDVMAKLCNVTTLQSKNIHLAAEVDIPRYSDFTRMNETMHRLLVLERCQDPGNLGTLIRSAIAFGFDGIFLLPGCADPFNDKSIRASRGGCFRIPMMNGTLDDWLSVCQRHAMVPVAADVMKMDDGRGFNDTHDTNTIDHYDTPISLVVGSEGQGLSDDVRQQCQCISIPMADDMESLNVATAASILMCLLSPAGKDVMTQVRRLNQRH
jgi:TrmH family RNA methyltransferase